jgi:exoribonuclease II
MPPDHITPDHEAALPAPHSGDEATFEAVDLAVAQLGLHRGLWMGDDRNMIHLVASIIDQAERLLPYLVTEAREDGCSWDDIAHLLGVSTDQAQARFDPDLPTADTRLMFDLNQH